MAIDKKRMQQRYGTFEQYTADKNNLLPNEFASVTSGDTSSTDGTALYFKSGTKDPIKVITENDNTFITISNKADKSNTLAGYGITNAYTREETDKKLARKLDSMPFDSEPTQNSPYYLTSGAVYKALLNKADKSTTLAGYGITNAYTKNAVDGLLADKANLVSSSNIFDFDTWAKGLQSLTKPVYNGTLDVVDFDEKSFALTATEGEESYTYGWTQSTPQSMKIAVKPNTKYLFSWLPSSTNCGAFVFLNGVNSETTRFDLKKGFGSFTTVEDTAYITIRFDYHGKGFFKVSEIMITEKESIYLPNKVAEGVLEVANEVLTFEKTTQTSLANKYDASNIESGSATLTPYSSQTDKSKSAVCTYKKVGDTLLATVTITLNADTLATNSTLHFIGLPFRHNSDTPVYFTGMSSKGGMFKGVVPKASTWLSIMSTITKTYTFTDDEQLNFTLMYKI